MENEIYFAEPKKWINDSKNSVFSIRTIFDSNAELSSDNQNVILHVHSVICTTKNKEYHYDVSYLISTSLLHEPFTDCKVNSEIFSQYIFKTQLQNQSDVENIVGKKLYLNINRKFITRVLMG